MTYIRQIEPSSYLAGQIADTNPASFLSLPNTDSVAIPFGIAMKIDGATQGYQLPASSGDVTNRMAVNLIVTRPTNYSYDNTGQLTITNNTSISPGGQISGAKLGDIAVIVEEAVTAGQQVYIRYASGAGGTQKGAFRASADTATAAAHPSWYYASSAAAGTTAIVVVR